MHAYEIRKEGTNIIIRDLTLEEDALTIVPNKNIENNLNCYMAFRKAYDILFKSLVRKDGLCQ